MKNISNSLFAATALLSTYSTYAATISWGGAQLSQNYSSDGTPLALGSSGSVMFELGIFQRPDGSEFVPTFENATDWADNWVPFTPSTGMETPGVSGYTNAVAGRGAALGENYFGNVVTLGSDSNEVPTFTAPANPSTEVTVNRQVYIWGFNDKDASSNPEWALFTGSAGGGAATDTNWIVPDSSASGNDSFTLVWDVFNADTAIVGMIPDSTGGGEMSPTAPKMQDDLQFAKIPEPKSILLVALSLSLLFIHKRR